MLLGCAGVGRCKIQWSSRVALHTYTVAIVKLQDVKDIQMFYSRAPEDDGVSRLLDLLYIFC